MQKAYFLNKIKQIWNMYRVKPRSLARRIKTTLQNANTRECIANKAVRYGTIQWKPNVLLFSAFYKAVIVLRCKIVKKDIRFAEAVSYKLY